MSLMTIVIDTALPCHIDHTLIAQCNILRNQNQVYIIVNIITNSLHK